MSALELQHCLGVCVEGSNSRRHAAGEGKPGCARNKDKQRRDN
jgi:hypothetical protein